MSLSARPGVRAVRRCVEMVPDGTLPDDFIHIAAREKVRAVFSGRRAAAIRLLALWLGVLCTAWLIGTMVVGPMMTRAAGLDAPIWRMRAGSASQAAVEPTVIIQPVR